jgi:acyl-CoA thioesterase-1
VVVRSLGIIGAAAAALTAAALVSVRLVERRRAAGGILSAESIPVNSSWWREQRTLAGELLYVAIGDSAAQGIGASRPGRSYVGLIAARIRETTGSTVRVVNLSISGGRVREALAKQLPALLKLEPDVVTVAIGANDIGRDFDPERFADELDELYSAVPSHTIVADVPSFYIGRKQRQVRVANGILRKIAARHGLVVAPLHARTAAQGAPWYVVNQVAADFFHPNDRGYRVWASAFYPQVARRLSALDGGLA